MVFFLSKSTEFHDMWTECQRIIIPFLLIISHKYQYALSASLFCICYRSPIAITVLLRWWSTSIGGDDLHKEDRFDIIMMMIHAEGLFQIQIRISFPFLLAKDLRSFLLVTRIHSFLLSCT